MLKLAPAKTVLGVVRRYAVALTSIVLAALCVQTAYLWMNDTLGSYRVYYQDYMGVHGDRIRGLKELLPKHGTVGYSTDDWGDGGQFYAIQYYIAPVVLGSDDAGDLVIVNNHKGIWKTPATGPVVSNSADGSTEYDFGNGIKLIDRRPRQ